MVWIWLAWDCRCDLGFWFCAFSDRLVLLVAAGSDGFGFAWIG